MFIPKSITLKHVVTLFYIRLFRNTNSCSRASYPYFLAICLKWSHIRETGIFEWIQRQIIKIYSSTWVWSEALLLLLLAVYLSISKEVFVKKYSTFVFQKQWRIWIIRASILENMSWRTLSIQIVISCNNITI